MDGGGYKGGFQDSGEFQGKGAHNPLKTVDDSLKVFVGNLPYGVTPESLQQVLQYHFNTCGKVTWVEIRPRGCAEVGFSAPEEAVAAVNTLNGTMIEGRPMNVRPWARPPPGSEMDGGGFKGGFKDGGDFQGKGANNPLRSVDDSLKVFVGNLPYGVASESLQQALQSHFGQVGRVTWVEIRPRGCAEIGFSAPEEALAAVNTLNGSIIEGRPMTVKSWSRPPPGQKGGLGTFQDGPGGAMGGKGFSPDWACSQCGYTNFARNPQCRQCGAARPPQVQQVPQVQVQTQQTLVLTQFAVDQFGNPVYRDASGNTYDHNYQQVMVQGQTAPQPQAVPQAGYVQQPQAVPQAGYMQQAPQPQAVPQAGYVQQAPQPQAWAPAPAAAPFRAAPFMDAKPGDWACAGCGYHNFARNPTCRQCGSGRPGAAFADGSQPQAQAGTMPGSADTSRGRSRSPRGGHGMMDAPALP